MSGVKVTGAVSRQGFAFHRGFRAYAKVMSGRQNTAI